MLDEWAKYTHHRAQLYHTIPQRRWVPLLGRFRSEESRYLGRQGRFQVHFPQHNRRNRQHCWKHHAKTTLQGFISPSEPSNQLNNFREQQIRSSQQLHHNFVNHSFNQSQHHSKIRHRCQDQFPCRILINLENHFATFTSQSLSRLESVHFNEHLHGW